MSTKIRARIRKISRMDGDPRPWIAWTYVGDDGGREVLPLRSDRSRTWAEACEFTTWALRRDIQDFQ